MQSESQEEVEATYTLLKICIKWGAKGGIIILKGRRDQEIVVKQKKRVLYKKKGQQKILVKYDLNKERREPTPDAKVDSIEEPRRGTILKRKLVLQYENSSKDEPIENGKEIKSQKPPLWKSRQNKSSKWRARQKKKIISTSSRKKSCGVC